MPEEFHKFIPCFDYHITKVSDIEKEILEKLKGKSILHALLLVYQKLSDKVFVQENFLDFFISFKDKPELEELFKMFFGYVVRKSELTAEEIEGKLQNATSESLNPKIMSTYDSIIAKGRNEGVAQGVAQEKIQGILKAIRRAKLTIEEIAEDFSVTTDYVLKIKKENKF